MERVLIALAVLVCIAAGVAVAAMLARGRRPPLRLESDLEEADEGLIVGSVGAPASPIDRSAPVLDALAIEGALVEARFLDARSGEARIAGPAAAEAGTAPPSAPPGRTGETR